MEPVHIIGAGLAGSEAAWQLAERGVPVIVHEMRPVRMENAFRASRILAPDRSPTSCRICRLRRIAASSITNDGDGTRVRSNRSKAPGPPALVSMIYLLSAFKLPVRDVKAVFARLEQDLVLTVYDLFEHAIPHLFGNGWRNLSPSNSTRAQLTAFPGYFADTHSILAAEAASAWRYRRELNDDVSIGLEAEKYNLGWFGRARHHYDCVFDCGSYDLGLLEFLKRAEVSFGSYWAFEADPACQA